MASGSAMHEFVRELFPVCRSITGAGVRTTLEVMSRQVSLEQHAIPSGTQVLDWTVPKEWNVRDAWVADTTGRRLIDFRENNLHLVSYSIPFRGRVGRDELLARLHSLPERPADVPYRTSYYREDWGFCVRHLDLPRFNADEYDVYIDTSLDDGVLNYGEYFLPGEVDREVLVYSHLCHPSLANDNLSGLAVTLWLARCLGERRRRLSYRFVWGPGTIGSIAWLARNEGKLDRIAFGLVAVLLGLDAPFHYKPSRRETTWNDRVMRELVTKRGGCVLGFDPYGYDERQFCSPGIDLPLGRVSRLPHGRYPEYHTSADSIDLVRPEALEGSLQLLLDWVDVLENDRRYRNTAPKGEPQLGRRGLYRAQGGDALPNREFAMLWMLNQSDGDHSVFDVAVKSGLDFRTLDAVAHELVPAGLLEETTWRSEVR